jgi:hypothetical protein
MAENVSGKPEQLPKSSVNFYERRGEVAMNNSETLSEFSCPWGGRWGSAGGTMGTVKPIRSNVGMPPTLKCKSWAKAHVDTRFGSADVLFHGQPSAALLTRLQ